MLEVPKPIMKENPSVIEKAQDQAIGRTRRRSARVYAFVVVLAVAIGAGFGAWAMLLRPIEVQVASTEQDVPVQVFGLGTVEARVTSRIGFKVSGVVIDLRADVGDRVAKGAVLARLDDREQNAQVARAAALVAQADANLQRATASLEKARVNHANAKSINERRQSLLKGNTTSLEAAQTAQAAQDAALADVNLAQSDLLVAKANIGDAKAQQQLQSTILDFYALTAPYDAMVTTRLKELGSALGAGESVFTLIDPETVWALAYVDESKAGEITVGEPAEIVLRSQPGRRIAGHVARIQPESDRVNEERRVEITFDTQPDELYLGEQAEAHITTVRLPQALLVPETAIAGLGGNHGTVWTIEDGYLEQRNVTLGHRLLDGRFEVTGGVPEHALVLKMLRSGLRVGRAAKVAEGASR
ncbi:MULTISPECIES: efflux RND transporter periplasmic adaptor subunit [Rhizobium/Agrobacterium group]|uniref:Efflux RND transporter periplasmic adaptor subunit n=2 Tax=Neorhizobium TaxID=1525371 RepID=A0ABV0MBG7_9HYPH|nr:MULTISPECIES: efflux RND transporter periplasmic adaptor subunit [Rhizobium/Agrobacterium group]MCC2609718.1 efflux RND transporter periplasmic adaptor subunit [Neorhizobium petrolearium]WGI69912.1 efflux RND transporter periplasmic adaptor subunit [Neorhizobium petrolearium]